MRRPAVALPSSVLHLCVALAWPACTGTGPADACASDADCDGAAVCLAGACVAGDAGPVVVACTQAAECGDDEVCVGGLCIDEDLAPTPCSTAAECADDAYCEPGSWTCQALPAGWCRTDAHCPSSEAHCSSAIATVAGQCFDCLVDDHCASPFTCRAGTCALGRAPDAGSPDDAGVVVDAGDPCGEHMVEVVPNVCVCLDGFVGDGQGGCAELPPEGGLCPENAHPVILGCACDDGFVANLTVSGCVLPEDCGLYTTVDDDACTCAPPYGLDPTTNGCRLVPGAGCPEHAHDDGGACVCDDGYVLTPDFQACEPVPVECEAFEFDCGDNTCLPAGHRCDTVPECADGSDEVDCPCGIGQLTCGDGTCVGEAQVCDQFLDCSDGADESGCGGCSPGQTPCFLDGTCVATALFCDGSFDCPDSTDEFFCD